MNDKKYDRILAKIENRLANFEINGKITKLTKLRSIEENILEEIKNGAENIIVAGDDNTLLKIINIVADYDIVLGMIPLGEEIEIAKMLGMPYGEEACEILSSRKIEVIDLGKINNRYFLSNVKLGSNNIEIICGESYKITPIVKSDIKICNIYNHSIAGKKKYFDPRDGFLEIVATHNQSFSDKLFKREKLEESVFPIKRAVIKAEKSITIAVDKETILKTPLEITVAPKKLKIIVGKDRIF
ncbi:MAG: diacylglycerol kinase family protein [bacterium]